MNAVTSHGATPIRMNTGEEAYQQKLKAAKQVKHNAYIDGINDTLRDGPGHVVSDSRTGYGAPRVMEKTIMEGNKSNYEIKDAPGNAPLNNYAKQTGSVELETSATNKPNEDPEDFQTSELDRRLKLYAQAGSNEGISLNNRSQTMRA